jgi:hypothetical protein
MMTRSGEGGVGEAAIRILYSVSSVYEHKEKYKNERMDNIKEKAG